MLAHSLAPAQTCLTARILSSHGSFWLKFGCGAPLIILLKLKHRVQRHNHALRVVGTWHFEQNLGVLD